MPPSQGWKGNRGPGEGADQKSGGRKEKQTGVFSKMASGSSRRVPSHPQASPPAESWLGSSFLQQTLLCARPWARHQDFGL